MMPDRRPSRRPEAAPGASALLVLFLAAVPAPPVRAEMPSGDDVLRRVDANIGSDTKATLATMIIHGRRGNREVGMRSWIQGMERSFTDYLSPARERGTRMLKLNDMLWTYSPATDRTLQISGHLLRNAVLGSDLSYEDLMEDPRLLNLYTATVTDSATVDGRACWVLDLRARDSSVAYPSRRIHVDQERGVVLREERFAKSGRLLKTTEVREVVAMGGRWVPTRMVFRDANRDGGGTEFLVHSIEFDVRIPESLFTKAALRRGGEVDAPAPAPAPAPTPVPAP